ncbi:CZB domain-containing protein [Hymenobacter sp. BT559]|uniref:CZB domain-containing protein n=1 Tax=Hymenobacter sp. BT559 TaxID=2795729 RepID=UPI0018EA3238|nr:CZB domain-containing protein [Hymenobacter sp. BT559]MBJ6145198.1 CZB domain-containing protein [Hymenobacter sp. BT559]
MSPDAIKQDFESALVKHFSFKAKLRSFLYGNNNSEGLLRDPDKCSLGQWITSRREGAYAHVPEMKELDRQHRLIHQQANALMDKYVAGQRDEALADFKSVQERADHITQLMQTIESKLRTAGA